MQDKPVVTLQSEGQEFPDYVVKDEHAIRHIMKAVMAYRDCMNFLMERAHEAELAMVAKIEKRAPMLQLRTRVYSFMQEQGTAGARLVAKDIGPRVNPLPQNEDNP